MHLFSQAPKGAAGSTAQALPCSGLLLHLPVTSAVSSTRWAAPSISQDEPVKRDAVDVVPGLADENNLFHSNLEYLGSEALSVFKGYLRGLGSRKKLGLCQLLLGCENSRHSAQNFHSSKGGLLVMENAAEVPAGASPTLVCVSKPRKLRKTATE